jgi:hypothetical protein
MKEKIWICIIILFITYACKNRNSHDEKIFSNVKTKSIRIFDINKFNSLNVNKTFSSGDTIISMSETNQFYFEKRSAPKSNFKHIFKYSKKDLQLVSEGEWFFLTPTGIHKTYDTSGKIVDETNFDKDYPFTVEQLIEKFEKEFKIELLTSTKHIRAERFLGNFINNSRPGYRIIIRNEAGSEEREINFDGISGEILKDRSYQMTD